MLHYSRILKVLFLLCLFGFSSAQKTFDNTRFDLNPNLPFEDPLPIIAESKDEKPKQILPKAKEEMIKPNPAPVTLPPPPPTIPTVPTIAPISSITLPPLSVISPASTFPTMPTVAPFSLATFPSPPATPSTVVVAPLAGSAHPQSNFIKSQGVRTIQLVPANQHRDRVDLWFKEVFDFRACYKNVDSVSEKFLQKFPRNLLKNNKEVILADLLNSRLKECVRKQERNEWNIIDQHIASLNLPASEENECRVGIVQEQISCYNVQSYSCQFVQPRYNFRLVPTRIIVQEARLAEDGAEKCRKVAKMLKKQKILNI
uniref:Uncharacterized protein n=1 Tax=Panagrolaimus superbus TaxID=310955 RepID=A0A914YRJ9_9BILA